MLTVLAFRTGSMILACVLKIHCLPVQANATGLAPANSAGSDQPRGGFPVHPPAFASRRSMGSYAHPLCLSGGPPPIAPRSLRREGGSRSASHTTLVIQPRSALDQWGSLFRSDLEI